ncbi:methyl-accepting chemotaxis protein [Caldimonas sp. KR1-144]|uniref:methyl-accepting chemotaxis protein n=1 Tax=Caldimonas sp. KR1-144 TaxID=3400911 RepID=UPI003C00F76F
MNRISIKARLLLLVALLLAMLVASFALGLLRLRGANAVLETVYNDRVVPLRQLKTVGDGYSVAIVDTAHKVRDGAMTPDEGSAAVLAARERVAREWQAYKATFLIDAEKQLVARAEPLMRRADEAGARLLELLAARDVDGIRVFAATQLYPAVDPVSEVVNQLSAVQLEVVAQEFAQAQETYRGALQRAIAAAAVVIASAAWLAWALVRSITVPLARAVQVAQTVADGDLTSHIEVRGRDETSRLLAALKRMNDQLSAIVAQVRVGSDSIATGSSQIAAGNVDLSQRTEEQACNLQQTAASMEELTATVKSNAATAHEAVRLASSACEAAGRGRAVVDGVVSTMDDISTSSRRIADIVGVIDRLAFQTGILALNAGAEAARAGEHGRGFSVVAGEVRALAQQSALAAKEIKDLIGESVARVDAGSALVGDAGRAMGDIVAQVRRVSDLIATISTASAEQSAGIGQIGEAVAQLDQVTQRNAALVEESAAAAQSLTHQAARLAQAVAQFRLAFSPAA